MYNVKLLFHSTTHGVSPQLTWAGLTEASNLYSGDASVGHISEKNDNLTVQYEDVHGLPYRCETPLSHYTWAGQVK